MKNYRNINNNNNNNNNHNKNNSHKWDIKLINAFC